MEKKVDKFADRLHRQSDIVPIDKLANRTVQVVGCGGIGRQVAIQLATMGVPNLMLVDGDTVEEHNFGVQGFFEKHLGLHKVEALKQDIAEINSSCNVEAIPTMFKKTDKHGHIVFACVDNMAARKLIWETVSDNIELFVDGRMLGLTMRVLCAFDEESIDHYEDPVNLFSDEQGREGRCTEKSTIFTANVIAGLMISNMVRWMRNRWTEKNFLMRPVQDITFDFLTLDLNWHGR